MNESLFRFTLDNTIEGSHVINEPDGWKDATLKLDRDKDYHSLIEFYDQPLTFYGSSTAKYDGGFDYVETVKTTQGPDADITILVEISEDAGVTFETLFSGLIDLSTYLKIDDYKIQCGVIRNDLWAKFWNHKGTSINLKSATGLFGGTRNVLSSHTLSLPTQKVRKSFVAENLVTVQLLSTGVENIVQIGTMDAITLDEIKERQDLPTIFYMDWIDNPIFSIAEDGDYTFDIRIEVSQYDPGTGFYSAPVALTFVAVKNSNPVPLATFATANFTSGGRTSTVYTYSATIALVKGDTFSFYGGISTIAAGEYYIIHGGPGSSPGAPSVASHVTYFNLTADTIFTDTSAETYKVHEVALSILDRIIDDDDMLLSTYMGNPSTQRIGYGDVGCASKFALMRGLHIKGFAFSEKPFTMSFDDFWAGMNPIFNMGLGYEVVSGTEVIRIENKAHFYDDSSTSVDLDYVAKINKSDLSERIYKNIKIGFEKWESETISGTDDPQTKHEYAVQLKKIGEETTLYSKFMAASLAIENTRRQSVEKTKDWRLDNDAFIIALRDSDYSQPELNEWLTSTANILNADTRYNMRLTPGRSFLRWRPFFNSCLQFYTSNDYKFQTGEGNTLFESDIDEGADDCDDQYTVFNFGESQNIDITSDTLHGLDVYEFEHPLTWAQYKVILANRKKAIGVSKTNSGHEKLFILSLAWSPVTPKGKFRCVKR